MDTDRPADEAWILGVQRKLYLWSKANPDEAWRDLWGWLTDPRTLRCAWRRVSSNRGARSAGADGVTVGRIRAAGGEHPFLAGLQADLRHGAYRPSPSRRVLIPKAGKPGQFRPLGIPTVADRVVQSAIKLLLEPIFEAQFWNVSHGFRPGRSTQSALEHIRLAILPRKRDADGHRRQLPYTWVIEGDIKGCFDNINHHLLMERLRKRVADPRMVRLIGQFLKAGVLAEDQFLRTDNGTPQGGIISPLLANIALSAIEERYERWTYHRTKLRASRRKGDGAAAAMGARGRDRSAGRCVFFPVRYADDFVVLVSGTQADAEAEKSALAEHLRLTTGLELSPEKTKVTAMTAGFEFLGFHVGMRWDKRYGYCPRVQIPKAKAADLRHKVKLHTGRNTSCSLGEKLQEINLITRGWAYYYRHCARAGRVFTNLDWYTGKRLWLWLRRKRPKAHGRVLLRDHYLRSRVRPSRRVWREGTTEHSLLAWIPVRRYRLAQMRTPAFAMSSGEPDAERKSQVRFGEGR